MGPGDETWCRTRGAGEEGGGEEEAGSGEDGGNGDGIASLAIDFCVGVGVAAGGGWDLWGVTGGGRVAGSFAAEDTGT
jgi:hypothetical protein